MKKSKKIIVGSVLATAGVATIATIAAFASTGERNTNTSVNTFTNRSPLSLERKREFISSLNASLQTNPFRWDQSASFGSVNSAEVNRLSVNLFRIETLGSPKFDSSGKVEEPTLSRYRFVYGAELIITMNDGSTHIFNSDEAEIIPSNTTNAPVIFRTSANPNSINSAEFFRVLNPPSTSSIKPIKMQIGIKKGQFWVNQKGEKTNFEIVPEDFYYSFMRTSLLTPQFRHENGGSKAIDDRLISQGVNTRFASTQRFPNGYLFGIFDVSESALRDRNKTITTNANSNEKYFTLNAIDNTKGANFEDTFKKMLVASLLFSAAPSQFIQQSNNNQDPNALGLNGESGLAKEFGIYSYAFDGLGSTTLFAGAYIPTIISPSSNREIWEKNRFYVDEEFVNSTTNINRLIFRYTPSTQADIFTQQSLNEFLDKSIDTIAFNSLNTAQVSRVVNVVRQTTEIFNTSLALRTVPVSAPNSGGLGKYTYNDAYSKLVYGSTLEEINSGNANVNTSYFAGFGLRFRSIIQSAVNWFTYASTISSQTFEAWNNTFAPDAIIGGKDQEDSQYKTLRTGQTTIDGINNTFTIEGVNGFTTINGVRTPIIENVVTNIRDVVNEIMLLNGNFEVLDTTNRSKDFSTFLLNLDNLNNQFKSLIFQKAQLEMKNLLDEFFNENPQLVGQKISWEYVYGFAATPPVQVFSGMQSIVNTINELDSRLNATFVVASSLPALRDKITNAFGASEFSGWGYDYDGIGTAFDGTTHGDATGLVPAFTIFAKLDPNSNLAKTFPEFYKLSKSLEMVAGTGQNPNFRISIPFSEWDKLTNSQLNHLQSTLQVKLENGLFSDISENFAKFFISYQNSHSNNELIALAREMNVIKGSSIEMSRAGFLSTNQEGTLTNVLRQPRFSLPITPVGMVFEEDIQIDFSVN